MPTLTGTDYVISPEKIDFDERFKAIVGPLAATLEHAAVQSLAQHFEPDTDPYYYHERRGPDGQLFEMPKIRTMHAGSDGPSDAELRFHKNNPRIVSSRARIIRSLGVDELPQVKKIPMLSVVGPRSGTDESLDYFTSVAATVDPGIARGWIELYHYPGIRHGFTGPGQLKWLWNDERDAKVMARSLRADLEYYTENASAAGDLKIIAATPFQLVASSIWKRLANNLNCQKR